MLAVSHFFVVTQSLYLIVIAQYALVLLFHQRAYR
jgi:hypothetical protein